MGKILVDKETGEEFEMNSPREFPEAGGVCAMLYRVPKPTKSLEEEVEEEVSRNFSALQEASQKSSYMLAVSVIAICRVLDRREREGKKGE